MYNFSLQKKEKSRSFDREGWVGKYGRKNSNIIGLLPFLLHDGRIATES